MGTFQILEQLQEVLHKIKEKEAASENELNQIEGIIKVLREEEVNDNFEGTVQEIHTFLDKAKATEDTDDLIKHHKLNLSRWTDEIQFLLEGGGRVTIDYEQRKGREI